MKGNNQLRFSVLHVKVDFYAVEDCGGCTAVQDGAGSQMIGLVSLDDAMTTSCSL